MRIDLQGLGFEFCPFLGNFWKIFGFGVDFAHFGVKIEVDILLFLCG